MKKRNVKPTTRTWATLLTFFPKSLEQSAEKVLSRYTLIYDEAQTVIQNKLQVKEDKEVDPDAGLQKLVEADQQPEGSRNRSAGALKSEPDAFEDPQFVSNQYMQILAHFGKLDEMIRVLRAMPASGACAPDAITFGIIFKALLDRNKLLKAARKSHTKADTEDTASSAIDKTSNTYAREIWDRLMQQHQVTKQSNGKVHAVLDEQNAVLGIRALSEGSAEDAALALTLLPDLYGLSRPGESAVARSNNQSVLPTFQLDDRSAETILKLCLGMQKNLDAAHFAKQFLDRPNILARFRQRQWQLMMAAFSNAHDCHMCQRLIEAFGPRNEQRRWSYQTYAYLFRSARSTKDMDRFLDLMEDYVLLPEAYAESNVRGGEPSQHRDLVAKIELSQARPPRDIPRRVSPTLEMATLMLETAIDGQRLSGMRQALRVSEVLKEGALIVAQRTQLIDDELAFHSVDRAINTGRMREDDEGIKPRNPEKVERRVQFWRRRRYERLAEILEPVLDASHMAEAGTSPQEQAKWEQMARLVREKLDPEGQEQKRPDTKASPPPRNVKEWKTKLHTTRRPGPYVKREHSRRNDSYHRDDRSSNRTPHGSVREGSDSIRR